MCSFKTEVTRSESKLSHAKWFSSDQLTGSIPFLCQMLLELVWIIFVMISNNFWDDLLMIYFLDWKQISCQQMQRKGTVTIACSLPVSLDCFWRNVILIFLLSSKTFNADLKISLYVCVQIKTIPRKFRILNPKYSRVIYPWSFQTF